MLVLKDPSPTRLLKSVLFGCWRSRRV